VYSGVAFAAGTLCHVVDRNHRQEKPLSRLPPESLRSGSRVEKRS
jgi:hypothetical protein